MEIVLRMGQLENEQDVPKRQKWVDLLRSNLNN